MLFSKKFGRIYYVKHIYKTFLVRLLSCLSERYLQEKYFQVATFVFDGIGMTINVKGVYEREQLDTIIAWLKTNHMIRGAVIDIGANIGNHSLYFSRFYEKVFSFEPNPRTFRLLEINSELVGNIKPFNFGLSDQDANVLMQFYPNNMGGSRIIDDDKGDADIISIKVKTFDSIDYEVNMPIGLLKLDVEGHEFAAILGAKEAIKVNKPIILFEQSPADFKDGRSPVIELLKSFGYSEFRTIMPSPFMSKWVPSFLRPALTVCVRLIMGFKYEIKANNNIVPGFYTFIIAVPDMDCS